MHFKWTWKLFENANFVFFFIFVSLVIIALPPVACLCVEMSYENICHCNGKIKKKYVFEIIIQTYTTDWLNMISIIRLYLVWFKALEFIQKLSKSIYEDWYEI